MTRKDTCTPVFIAALFAIAKTWKQPKCPSTEEWIKKMWYIYTMEPGPGPPASFGAATLADVGRCAHPVATSRPPPRRFTAVATPTKIPLEVRHRHARRPWAGAARPSRFGVLPLCQTPRPLAGSVTRRVTGRGDLAERSAGSPLAANLRGSERQVHPARQDPGLTSSLPTPGVCPAARRRPAPRVAASCPAHRRAGSPPSPRPPKYCSKFDIATLTDRGPVQPDPRGSASPRCARRRRRRAVR